MGFLLSGVLSDYKESERMPGELAAGLGGAFLDWFYKSETTNALVERLDELTVHFAALEPWAQANLIADTTTALLCLGLVLIRIDPFYEAIFLSGLITFLLVFLRTLIRDLDNPFGYYERASGEDV